MDGIIWLAEESIAESREIAKAPAVGVKIMPADDWRSQLDDYTRSRISHKIVDTLMRHTDFSNEEAWGWEELDKIAIRFEEKIYNCATSQEDYLRKISIKMLSMETKSDNPTDSYVHSNDKSNAQDPEPQSTPSQIQNQARTIDVESQG